MLATTLPYVLSLSAVGAGALSDLYVDTLATNCVNATGSMGQPFCTITDALAAAVDGDRILIRPGTYLENLIVPKDLELVGLRGDRFTVVDGGGLGTTVTVTPGAAVTIEGLRIQGGLGSKAGGVEARGPVTLRNSTVSGNESTGEFAGGGCLFLRAGSSIEGCTIEANVGASSIYSASAIWTEARPLTVTNSTISGNTAAGPVGGPIGGAIFVYNSDLTMRDSTVSGNQGPGINMYGYGASGGLYNASIEGSTIVGNDATGFPFGSLGGGISEYGTFPVSIQNTIIAGNAGHGSASDVSGSFVSLSGNLVGNGDGALGLAGVPGDQLGTTSAPLLAGLAPLALVGGRTRTHEPLASSPAVDSGVDVPGGTTDQRGVPHPVGSRDVGAHERGVGRAVTVCVPALNTAGYRSLLQASANLDVAQNSMYLTMLDLPRDVFGFCITSRTVSAPVQPPMSQGNLCLSVGVGRLTGPSQIRSSGAAGRIQIPLDLTQHPTPGGQIAVMAGETWYFQGWHRDTFLSAPTSNFSSAVEVSFP